LVLDDQTFKLIVTFKSVVTQLIKLMLTSVFLSTEHHPEENKHQETKKRDFSSRSKAETSTGS